MSEEYMGELVTEKRKKAVREGLDPDWTPDVDLSGVGAPLKIEGEPVWYPRAMWKPFTEK